MMDEFECMELVVTRINLLNRATPKQIALASGDRRRGGVEVTVAEAWRALEWLVDGMPKMAERLET